MLILPVGGRAEVQRVSDIRGDLASLRIDREPAGRRRPRWPLAVAALALVAGALVLWRVRSAMAAVEVETVRPSVAEVAAGAPGSPVLTASGYVVARRKAVVSAKI